MTPEERAVIDLAIRSREVALAGLPSVADKMREAIDALIYSCSQCNAGGHVCPGDGNPIGHTQTDCGQHDDPHQDSVEQAAEMLDSPEWVETTMRQCLAGDRIRIGAEETDVIRSSSGIWHADSSDAWHPRAWEHLELRMELAVVPGFTQYPPNASVEILCSPERKAALLLQNAFPGTTVIS